MSHRQTEDVLEPHWLILQEPPECKDGPAQKYQSDYLTKERGKSYVGNSTNEGVKSLERLEGCQADGGYLGGDNVEVTHKIDSILHGKWDNRCQIEPFFDSTGVVLHRSHTSDKLIGFPRQLVWLL